MYGLAFDHTHDLGLVVSRGIGGLIDMDWKGYESIIHDHNHDLWVTMVGLVGVQDRDWGDFRCRRASDISSSSHNLNIIYHNHMFAFSDKH